MSRQVQDVPLFGSLSEDKEEFIRGDQEMSVLENVSTTTMGTLKKRNGYAAHSLETSADAKAAWVGASERAAYTWLAVGVRGVVPGTSLSAGPLLYSAPPITVQRVLRVDPDNSLTTSLLRMRGTNGHLLVIADGDGSSGSPQQWIYATATGRVVRPIGLTAVVSANWRQVAVQGWGGKFWAADHPVGASATIYRLNPSDAVPAWTSVASITYSGNVGRPHLIAGNDRIFFVNASVGPTTGLAVVGFTSSLATISTVLSSPLADSGWGFFTPSDNRLIVGDASSGKTFRISASTLAALAVTTNVAVPTGDTPAYYDVATSTAWSWDVFGGNIFFQVSAATLASTSQAAPDRTIKPDFLFPYDGQLYWSTGTPNATEYDSRDIVRVPTTSPSAVGVWTQKLGLDAGVSTSPLLQLRGTTVSNGVSSVWVLSPEISRAAGEFSVREVVTSIEVYRDVFFRLADKGPSRVPVKKRVKRQFTDATDILGFGIYRVTFQPKRLPPAAQVGGDSLIVGGAQNLYVTPAGDAVLAQCPLEPELVRTTSGVSGAVTVSGSYLFGLQYEIPVGNRLIRSVPALTAVQPANTKAIRMQARTTGVVKLLGGLRPRVKFYRSDVNGSVLYLQNEQTITATTVQITYTATDSNVVLSTPVMAFSVGELANAPAPPFYSIASGNRRVWGISSLLRSQLWPSKLLVEGVGVEWADELIVDLSSFRITPEAVGVIDDKAVVLGDGQIVVVFGEGPDNIGGGAPFGVQEVETVAGCHNRLSLVGAAGVGLLYQSRSGIMLLNRQLEEINIGRAIENTIQGQILHSPAHLSAQEEVRWVVGDTATIVVYNYGAQTWSTYAFASSAVDNIRSATILDNAHLLLTESASGAARTVLQTSGTYADLTDGEVLPKVVTPWYRPTGMQGHFTLCRLQLLGRRKGAHNLQVRIAYDYSGVYEQTFTFLDAMLSTITPYQLELYPSRRRCQCFRLEITETVSAGQLTQGVELVAASMEYIPHAGLNRIPQTNRR